MRKSELNMILVLPLLLAALATGCKQTGTQSEAVSGTPGGQDAAPSSAVEGRRPAAAPATPRSAAPAASQPSAQTQQAEQERYTAPQSVTLPQGTALKVRLIPTLSTETHKGGETFEATLAEPLVVGGQTVVPRGASVTGKVVESDAGGRVKGVAHIAVQMTSLAVNGGRQVSVVTDTVSHEANTTKGKDAAKVGIGSGVGAAIGAIAGGGKGAAIGAAAGGAAGTGVVLATRGEAAVLPSESVLTFTLQAPVQIQR